MSEERLCVWPTGVHFNFLVALLDVDGKQTYTKEAEQIDQFELPVSDEDLRNWVRQGRDAVSVISTRESLHESIYKHELGFG